MTEGTDATGKRASVDSRGCLRMCILTDELKRAKQLTITSEVIMQYITHDARATNKSNLRIRKSPYDINTVELISYDTVVAYGVLDNRDWTANEMGYISIFEMIHDSDWFFTERKYSPTTSKQVTRFLNAVCGGRANATELKHETFRKALTDFATKCEVQYA